MNLPLDQQAIRAKCFHPSGRFAEFPLEDVALSIRHDSKKSPLNIRAKPPLKRAIKP
jgi:hypothetical protein